MRVLKWIGGVVLALIVLVFGALLVTQWQIARLETFSPEDDAPGTYVTVNGKKLHVQTIGDPKADPTGAPMVLIHGAEPGGLLTWSPWAVRFLGKRSVVMIDQIGFGHSERPTAPGPDLSMQARAKDIVAVADQLGIAQFDLVGFSYGGHIAAQVALDAPDRIRKLVFIGAVIYVPKLPPVMDVPLLGRAISFYMWGGAPYGVTYNRCIATGQSPDTCPSLRLARVKVMTDAMAAGLSSGALDPTLEDRVGKIATPTLVNWGANDREIPVKDGDRLAQALHARLRIIANAGHWAHQDAPDRTFDAVIGFLGG